MANNELGTGDLSGLTVLVTRPLHQQQSLTQAIETLGGQTLSLPLIDIEPLTSDELSHGTSNGIHNLDHFDILIIISSNAARIGGELINDFWPQFPVGITVISMGQATARVATTLLNCTVVTPSHGSDSEAVLALPELADVDGRRVGILRGTGGRELLARELRQRGAEVEAMEVYRRVPKHYQPDQVAEALINPALNVITVHSGESLQSLLELCGNNINEPLVREPSIQEPLVNVGEGDQVDNQSFLNGVGLIPLIVPSARVQELAQKAGFARVINAHGADDRAMTKALQQLADCRCKGNPC